MPKHLQRELDLLKRDLLEIGALVEDSLRKAMVAFEERRTDLVDQVIDKDCVIDAKEVEVEESCLKVLALHQPVAEDLRFITAVMKINNDLERMGDSAVGIARRGRHLAKEAPVTIPTEIHRMREMTLAMVHDCLDAFVRNDTKLAREVCIRDDEVDQIQVSILRAVRGMMQESGKNVDPGLDIFTTVRRLERVADLATNIAEDVIYMVEGEIIRHKGEHL